MALLLSCQNVTKSFSHRPLFAGITLGLYDGERCGMFGPNGAGKSTFLKILAQREQPDEGTLESRRGIKVGYVAQEDKFTAETPHEELFNSLANSHLEDHEKYTQVAIMLTKVGFDDSDPLISTLSGGWRKRLALARELLQQPDLLLLDEPTNHLDLEGILWLESLLKAAQFAYVVVTHDRYFLENVTNRVIEINRVYSEGYLSVPGTYTDFLARRDVVLAAQQKEQSSLQNKVRTEIEWLKRGPKARRTKAKSRIEDAHTMIADLAEVKFRNSQGQAVDIEFSATDRQTRKLIAVHALVKSLGDRLLISKLNLVLAPGMKLGVLGPNGSGKSTFLKLLTGQLEPDAGTIKLATGLRTVFFDQQRQALNKRELLKDALSPNADSVLYNGELIHVTSWAKRFLFRIDQLDRPVGELSGGEQARVLIARLMLSPADVLILDEPTNDLDIPSLEVLEASLDDFPGALVLVTHDRFMLDRVSTEILGLDGAGGHGIFADYDQYENWVEAREKAQREAARAAKAQGKLAPVAAVPVEKKSLKKLTMKEQKEFEAMETIILEAEQDVQKWHAQMEDPAIIAVHAKLTDVCGKLQTAQNRVAQLYKRWEELEAKLA